MTTSLNLAKEVKEAGIEINPQFHWSKEEHDGWELNMFKDRKWSYFWEEEDTCLGIKATPLDDSPEAIEYGIYNEHAPAPTTDEWLEFLPSSRHFEEDGMVSGRYSLQVRDSGEEYEANYYLEDTRLTEDVISYKKPSDALAKLAIQLREEGFYPSIIN